MSEKEIINEAVFYGRAVEANWFMVSRVQHDNSVESVWALPTGIFMEFRLTENGKSSAVSMQMLPRIIERGVIIEYDPNDESKDDYNITPIDASDFVVKNEKKESNDVESSEEETSDEVLPENQWIS
jgi:hypothetical protein